jgi:hypothetical protein
MIMLTAFTATGASAAPLRGTPHPRPPVNHTLTAAIHYNSAGDTLTVTATRFPANKTVHLYLVFSNHRIVHLSNWKADRNGNITATFMIATYPSGTTFRVLARVSGGLRVMSNAVVVQ